jgi:DNA-binding MurR/RpiR family transcriptional regulator
MGVSDRLSRAQDELTPAERRVGEVLARQPQVIAFETVAELARRTETGGATVVRFANKLGFEGFRELQQAVQAELTERLRPAAERIGQAAPVDVVRRSEVAARDGIASALAQLDEGRLDHLVEALADPSHRVWLASGDASSGIVATFAQQLAMLRPGVALVGGNAIAVGRDIAEINTGDVFIALDFARYDAAMLRIVQTATAAGARLIALTDSPLSPLAMHAEAVVLVTADSPSPFDSYIAAMAVFEVLAGAIAARSTAAAAPRLERLEQVWRSHGALLQD